MLKMKQETTNLPLARQIEMPRSDHDEITFWWLGQAGFLFQYRNCTFMIDPYLSDCLAKKYADSEFKHIRMMPPPIEPNEITNLNWILCSHSHSDHMDPESLPLIIQNNPACRIIAPAADSEKVKSLGLDCKKIVSVAKDDTVTLTEQLSVKVTTSAHETISKDSKGNDHFLGFIIHAGDIVIYHSGDCVPYPGLARKLADEKIDIALLPVNGRDEYRQQRNIAGNFTFEESRQLCRQAGIEMMVCHHFGMFAFNTIDTDELKESIKKTPQPESIIIPEPNKQYVLTKD